MFRELEYFEKIKCSLGVVFDPELRTPQGRKPFIVIEYKQEGGLLHSKKQTDFESIIDAVDYIHTLYFDNEITGGF